MPLPGWVAGLNHGSHDASCALLHGGELVAFVEQERLSRRKRAAGEAPAGALAWCLDFAGIGLADLECVALGSDHALLAQWLGVETDEATEVLRLQAPQRLFPSSTFGDAPAPPTKRFRHHLAHAASAFWPSGFEEAAIIVLDAMGEDASGILGYGTRETGVDILATYPIDVSLGYYYEAATAYAGFDLDDAGKLMGLASYGRPNARLPLRLEADGPSWQGIPAATSTGRGSIVQRTESLLQYFESQCFPYTRALREETMAYADFAASVQASLNDAILGLAARVKRDTEASNLVLAGGVALNCTANGKLAEAGLFDDVFVQPAAHDAGVALGAALLASHELAGGAFRPERMRHAYWGPATDDGEVERELTERGLAALRLEPDHLVARTAELVARGGVVGWHQGRAEVGPRALGARSLLGDPRHRQTLVRLNRIKRREVWRPLAPSVLEPHFHEFFAGVPNPFMIVAAQVRPEAMRRIPAVVHVDGSARPHVVRAVDHPLYAALLQEFRRVAGVPVLVNTSLNVKDEPMCAVPADTIRMFLATDIDALAIGSFFVVRT